MREVVFVFGALGFFFFQYIIFCAFRAIAEDLYSKESFGLGRFFDGVAYFALMLLGGAVALGIVKVITNYALENEINTQLRDYHKFFFPYIREGEKVFFEKPREYNNHMRYSVGKPWVCSLIIIAIIIIFIVSAIFKN